MQINLSYHGKAFKSIEDALDPQKNVTYAAKYLKSLYLKKGKDWLKRQWLIIPPLRTRPSAIRKNRFGL